MANLSASLPITLLVLLAGAGAADARSPSLCAAAEETVFACAQGRKIISLCAAPPIAGATRRLRYVYGAPGKIELEISQPDEFTSGITALSGGGIDYVRVRSGDVSYVLYTGQTQTWSQDGWIVQSKDTPIAHHICKAAATGANGWAAVYAAKLPADAASDTFSPPDWVGAPPHPADH
jgi:hypothetical protein